MDLRTVTRQLLQAGKAMLAASLFLVLVWWRGSVTLFLAGAVVYGGASLLGTVWRGEPLEALLPAQE